MNRVQIIQQQRNIKLIRALITKHHSRNIRKIKIALGAEYDIKVSERTVKRYSAIIAKEDKKIIAEKNKIKNKKPKIAKPKIAISDNQVKDPSGKLFTLPPGNSILEIQWGNQGLIYWDKGGGIWKYSSNHKPFDKNKKIKKIPKIHSNNIFEFDDI